MLISLFKWQCAAVSIGCVPQASMCSENIVIVNFLFILVTFHSGILTPYIVAREPIDPCEQNKEI